MSMKSFVTSGPVLTTYTRMANIELHKQRRELDVVKSTPHLGCLRWLLQIIGRSAQWSFSSLWPPFDHQDSKNIETWWLSENYYTVKVLKFRTLVVCQKSIDKQCRLRSDCFWRSSLIRVFSVCYYDKHFGNSSPDIQHFIWEHRAVANDFIMLKPTKKKISDLVTFQIANNKGADQTSWMRRLVYAFVVHKQQSQDFSCRGQYVVEAQASWPPPGYAPG